MLYKLTKKIQKCRIIIGDIMWAKDKRKNRIKNVIIFFIVVTTFLMLLICYKHFYIKNEVLAKETNNIEINSNNIKISNANLINIEEIINKNTNKDLVEEYITEETDLEYITKYQTNGELPKGIIQVLQEGREGKQEITIKRIYENGQIVSEEQVNSKITKASVNKIVEIGSGRGSSTYKVKKGDIVYIISDRAEIRVEPDEESQKIATLTKGIELKVINIDGNWYQVTGQANGYIKIENTTSKNPTDSYKQEDTPANTGGNIESLSFDMKLNKPSGLNLEQFKKVLTDSKDTNKVMQNNAEYFYYIEQQYNINGIFVAAIGIHESGWGSSQIAKDKNNLFGYGSYDETPYESSMDFENYEEGIETVAKSLTKYYLNPAGTKIYNGEIAQAWYYNGPTLQGVNTRYASDKEWYKKVYSYMEMLYNRL